jgi:hypothetical protein
MEGTGTTYQYSIVSGFSFLLPVTCSLARLLACFLLVAALRHNNYCWHGGRWVGSGLTCGSWSL